MLPTEEDAAATGQGLSKEGEEYSNNETTRTGLSTRRPKRVKEKTVSYFRQISATFYQSEEDPEQTELLIENAIEEMKGFEASMASHKMCSTVVEQLLMAATRAQLFNVAESFLGFYLHLFTNRYGSHVLETLLYRLSQILASKGKKQEETSDRRYAISLLEQICDELEAYWSQLMRDTCGCHCLRSLTTLLSGRELPEKESQKKRKRKRKRKSARNGTADSATVVAAVQDAFELDDPTMDVPDRLRDVVDTILRSVVNDCGVSASWLWQNPGTSGTLQHMLLIAHHFDTVEPSAAIAGVLDALLTKSDEQAVERMAMHPSGSPLLETLLFVSDDRVRSRILNEIFVQSASTLAFDDYGNFAFQRILSLLSRDADICAARRALEEHAANLVERGRTGVLWRLVEACGRSKSAVRGTTKMVVRSAGRCDTKTKKNRDDDDDDDDHSWLKRFLFGAHARDDASSTYISAMACRTIRALMELPIEECRRVLEAVAALDVASLERLAKHPWGSRHVIESILDGPVGFDWARQKMLKTCLSAGRSNDDHRRSGSFFSELSMNRFGAFCVQKFFGMANPSNRRRIVKQLAAVERKLSGDRMGTKVLERCRVRQFVDAPKDWYNYQTKQWEHAQRRAKVSTSRESRKVSMAASKSKAKKKIATPSNAIDDIFEATNTGTERKRKRRRKKKSTTHGDAESHVAAPSTDDRTDFILKAIGASSR